MCSACVLLKKYSILSIYCSFLFHLNFFFLLVLKGKWVENFYSAFDNFFSQKELTSNGSSVESLLHSFTVIAFFI